jgi:hypothetical protein
MEQTRTVVVGNKGKVLFKNVSVFDGLNETLLEAK